MEPLNKFFHDIMGIEGFSVLQKAIYKKGTQSVLDPMELLLPLIVVPRAILSWLVQNIKPMTIGEHKTFEFPGRSDITLWVLKQDTDVYKGEFVQKGKVIQTFDKQSLPTVAATLMTTGELYDQFNDKAESKDNSEAPKPDDKLSDSRKNLVDEHENLIDTLRSGSKKDLKDEASKQAKELEGYKTEPADDSSGVVRYIMDINDINITINNNGSAQQQLNSGNVKEAISHIGSLIDSLVGKKISSDKTISRLQDPEEKDDYEGDPVDLINENTEEDDDMDKKELKGEDQKVEPNQEVDKALKAEMPGGAAVPKAPAMPKPPVPAGTKPAGAAAKQAQLSATGKPPSMGAPKGPMATSSPAPKMSVNSKQTMAKDDMGWTGASNYFRKKLGKTVQKTEKVNLTHEDVFSPCIHCGTAEFKKNEQGKVEFKPCACFSVEKYERKGKEDFVTLTKNDNGSYNVAFANDADPDSVRAFLLTLKARLLVERKLNKR